MTFSNLEALLDDSDFWSDLKARLLRDMDLFDKWPNMHSKQHFLDLHIKQRQIAIYKTLEKLIMAI